MKKYVLYSLAVVGVAALGLAGFGAGETSAASVTLNPGDNINTTILGAVAGDVITLSAGEYPISGGLSIESASNVSLVGQGNVVLKYDRGANSQNALRILDGDGVRVENLTIEATVPTDEADYSLASNGIALAESCNVALEDVTIKGFGRAAVEVRAMNLGTGCAVENLTFNNFTSIDSQYGILFMNSTGMPTTDINGLVFDGVTTISGAAYGIMMSNQENLGSIYGPDGAIVHFGTVNITTTGGEYTTINLKGTNRGWVSMDSRLNGALVADMNYKDFCLLVGAYVLPDAPCDIDTGEQLMAGYNCQCNPDDPNSAANPCLEPAEDCGDQCPPDTCPAGYDLRDGNCVPVGPRVPNTGSSVMEGLAQSGAIWTIGLGIGAIVGGVFAVRWLKKYNRIKL